MAKKKLEDYFEEDQDAFESSLADAEVIISELTQRGKRSGTERLVHQFINTGEKGLKEMADFHRQYPHFTMMAACGAGLILGMVLATAGCRKER